MPSRLLFGLLLAAPAPLFAQQAAPAPSAASPSVEAYLCTFAGKCNGADAPVATRDAPATKGFRLARPTGARDPEPVAARRSGAARASLAARARTARTRYAPAAPAVAYGAAQPAASVAAAAASAPRRADLMIGFELNSAQLTREGMGAAQVFARSLLMPELQGKRFLIEGHTDLRGGRAVNASLSARRAEAVAAYLGTLGVDRSRLRTRGYGSSKPLPGHGAADPANRRVEAELLS